MKGSVVGTRVFILLCAVVLIGCGPTFAEEGPVPRDLAGLAAFRLEGHLGRRTLLLAEAIPADSYGWRPAAGVRSVGELFTHVGSSYYWFAFELGVERPADLPDWKQLDGKEEIVSALKRSLMFFRHSLEGLTEEDLSREIDFYGRKTSKRELVLNAMTHGSEHLGQAIAYARSLGVSPPWSDG